MTPIRVLILEDHPHDAWMMIDELRRAGFDSTWQRVVTEASFLSRLSATIAEGVAAEAMRNGADDYISKNQMDRLGPAAQKAFARRREKEDGAPQSGAKPD